MPQHSTSKRKEGSSREADGSPITRQRRVSTIPAPSDVLEGWFRDYANDQVSISVDFRRLVGPIRVTDLSHSVYPYPARLLRQIPRFFLSCHQLASSDSFVLDPFCGSGTVLVEAQNQGIPSWGIDSNPFARLLSEVKTTQIDIPEAREVATQIVVRARRYRQCEIPAIVNMDYWFSKTASHALGCLKRAIDEAVVSEEYRRYLLVCLAFTAEKSSLRDLRIPVPVRRNDWEAVVQQQSSYDVSHLFEETANSFAVQLASLQPPTPREKPIVLGDDAAKASIVYGENLVDHYNRPDLIITSPPYGAAQKYIRSTSLALGWTGLASSGELAGLERLQIGREHLLKHERTNIEVAHDELAVELAAIYKRNSVRAAIYAHYFTSMVASISEVVQLLRPGGMLVLVAGSNVVAGKCLSTHRYLRDISVHQGLTPVLELQDNIRGRVLLTKRAAGAAPLKYETIHMLRKGSK